MSSLNTTLLRTMFIAICLVTDHVAWERGRGRGLRHALTVEPSGIRRLREAAGMMNIAHSNGDRKKILKMLVGRLSPALS